MIEIDIEALPDGFYVNDRGNGMADVIYDVTPSSFGTWTGVRVHEGKLQLFHKRSYRHQDLLKRLGIVVPE